MTGGAAARLLATSPRRSNGIPTELIAIAAYSVPTNIGARCTNVRVRASASNRPPAAARTTAPCISEGTVWASSAVLNPLTLSHRSMAAAALATPLLHARIRRLTHAGHNRSRTISWRRTYPAYVMTAMCTPYDRMTTASTGAVAPIVSGTEGLRSTTSNVRYTAATRPTKIELLSMRR